MGGPFVSPFESALAYDSLILVATGIGITPCLGVMNTCCLSRSVNLIWICRDASMVEFYLSNMILAKGSWAVIYYTGTRPLAISRILPKTVLVFAHRPDFDSIIRHIILAVETNSDIAAAQQEVRQRTSMVMQSFCANLTADQAKSSSLSMRESALDCARSAVSRALLSLRRDDLLRIVTEHLGLLGDTDACTFPSRSSRRRPH